jgi:hypothetical protein
MATIEIITDRAKPSTSGGFSVIMDISGRPAPMPKKTIEARNLAEVQAALSAHIAEAKQLGEPLAVCVRAIGRAPSGFKAWRDQVGFYHRVNV